MSAPASDFIGSSGIQPPVCRSPVGTLWPVDDLSTPLLMVKFYELHLHGTTGAGCRESPGAALRSAQLWLRDLSQEDMTKLLQETDLGRRLAANGLTTDCCSAIGARRRCLGYRPLYSMGGERTVAAEPA